MRMMLGIIIIIIIIIIILIIIIIIIIIKGSKSRGGDITLNTRSEKKCLVLLLSLLYLS